MARIPVGRADSIFSIKKWLGLNENPEGDTKVGWGEAANMRNFRITKEGSLQIRPGYKTMLALSEGHPVREMWTGYVGGVFVWLCVCGGYVYRVDWKAWTSTVIGEVEDAGATIFPFGGKVYILDGAEYYVWDGTGEIRAVGGYVPIIATATPPSGGGAPLEAANKLTGKKRQQFSPTGSDTLFVLAERDVSSIDSVKVDGTEVTAGITKDTEAGTVTWASPPAAGTNTVEIMWTKGTGDRAAVTGMRFYELYNGANNTRVFLYGDGSNRAVYSGLDEFGKPSAEYFPDLNVLDAGSANTPITGLIRHFSRLIVFKSDSAYSVQYTAINLDDGHVTAGFYITPIHRDIGHQAPGQLALVENNPWTLFGGAAYEWKSAGSGLAMDERHARRRSDRVGQTLRSFNLARCTVFDDNERQELYLAHEGTALVYQYAADSWYRYENFPAVCFAGVGSDLYFGSDSGCVMRVSRTYHSDNGREIDAYWESGSLSFDRAWKKKNTCQVLVSMKPESQAGLTVTVQSDLNSNYPQKVIASGLSSFANASFGRWSFGTNRKPRIKRVKLRLKNYVYCKLIFSSRSAVATATVLGVDMRVRETGNVK